MKFSIYVPSKSPKMDLTSMHKNIVQIIAGRLCELCGGATSTNGYGYWKDSNGVTISEEVTIIHTFGDASHKPDIIKIADNLRAMAKQDCVLVEIDGEAVFIEPCTAKNCEIMENSKILSYISDLEKDIEFIENMIGVHRPTAKNGAELPKKTYTKLDIEIEEAKRMKAIKRLWESLGDIPVTEDGEIEEPFLHFEIGDDRESIWLWFEEKFNLSVVSLMYNH